MTGLGTQIGALLAAGAVAAGGLLGAGSGRPAPPRTAVVVDAAIARDGRALVDPRLRAVDADVRLPRTQAEANTDVRYFTAAGYDRVVVAGPRSTAAGAHTAVADRATSLDAALAAVGH
ncbi:MAG: hypothetical protein V7607_1767 [Solirubrobacteraceae bacterium]